MRPHRPEDGRRLASHAAADTDETDDLDEEMDLPLVDDDGEEGDPGKHDDADDLLAALDDRDDPDPHDDANASELDTGIDIDPLRGDEKDRDDDGGLDVGALEDDLDLDDIESGAGDQDDGIRGDQGDLDIDDHADQDDGGAEGTNEAPEDEVDEKALPDLDSDDEAEGSGEDLADVLLAEVDEVLPPWDTARWVPLEGAGATLPCSAITIGARAVVAAGEVLLLVDEGARAARRATFGASAAAVALVDDLLFAATARGQLFSSRDGGVTAAPGGWRAGHGTVDLAATPGRLWIRCDDALLSLTGAENPLVTLRERGVLGMATSGGTVVVVSRGETVKIERLRGDDEGWQRSPLRASARAIAESGSALKLVVAAGGRCLALTDGVKVAISRDGGAVFAIAEVGPVAALAFAGDADDAPLIALVAGSASAADSAWLDAAIVLVPRSGSATRVAAIPALTPGSHAALAWDAAREVVWVACSAGLLALGPALRH